VIPVNTNAGTPPRKRFATLQITAEHLLLGTERSNHRCRKHRNALSIRFRLLKDGHNVLLILFCVPLPVDKETRRKYRRRPRTSKKQIPADGPKDWHFIKPEDFAQIDTTKYEVATISRSRVPQYKKYPTSMTCASILSDRRPCL
jgi:hypothetical protein